MSAALDTSTQLLGERGYAWEGGADGVTVTHRGSVDLYSLTALPESYPVTFSNSGRVYLDSISPEPQMYQGKLRRFRYVDGWTMLLESSRKAGDCTIHKARHFRGGPVAEMSPCYLAQDGDVWAHGDTIAEAKRDLRFKIAQVDYDADDLIAEVKRTGVITWLQFRLLTGACEAGLRRGLIDLGLDADTDHLPLADAMRYVAGRYGEARMREAFGGAS